MVCEYKKAQMNFKKKTLYLKNTSERMGMTLKNGTDPRTIVDTKLD